MAHCTINNIRIAGIASAIPSTQRDAETELPRFGQETVDKIVKSVGVRTRRIAPVGICTSDLCFAAAERLLCDLNWKRNEIRSLIFVTQTPDYILPATSHVLHQRLGLPASCCVFDVNLGCSGYVYGLWMAANTAQSLGGRVLLLVGDTISKIASPEDQSVTFVFGDAGTATAIEPGGDRKIHFELGSDGSGWSNLIVPAGGFRRPHLASAVRRPREDGGVRSDEDLFMDGAEIFTFTLKRVPSLVEAVLKIANQSEADIDFFVFHQANRFMLEHLAKKMKLPSGKVVLGLERYGNTSSASIPLAIATELRDRLGPGKADLLLAGFGVGYSWAAATLNLDSAAIAAPVEV